MVYKDSTELNDAVEKVVARYHPTHLDKVNVVAVMQDGDAGAGPKVPTPFEKFLIHEAYDVWADFVVKVNSEKWKDLAEFGRLALLDHYLTGCGVSETSKGIRRYKIRQPEVQEFVEVFQRHKGWNPEVRRLAAISTQLQLFESDAERDEAAAPPPSAAVRAQEDQDDAKATVSDISSRVANANTRGSAKGRRKKAPPKPKIAGRKAKRGRA